MFSTLSKTTLARAALLQDAPVYVQFYITARCNLTCKQCNIIYANSDVRECTLDEIKRMIEAALPGAEVELLDEGGGDHLRAIVAAPQFDSMKRIDQHRAIRDAVRERFEDGSIHALSIETTVLGSD